MVVRIYVEGGGDSNGQRLPLRKAVVQWIEKAVPGARPIVNACGGRRTAFEDFNLGIKSHPEAFCILLVDSEDAVKTTSRWEHVRLRDGWAPPSVVTEENLHFMTLTMEAWLCADPEALEQYFGQGFKAGKLPQRNNLEEEPKIDLNQKLEAATRGSKKGSYKKGAHLEVLGFVDPQKVMKRCPSAVSFVETLKEKLKKG